MLVSDVKVIIYDLITIKHQINDFVIFYKPESCMEHEVRLNNFYGTDTMEDFFQNPYRYSVFFIKEDKEELSKGKVEICVNGTWGTICEGQSWNNSAASVACNQLGFSRYGKLSMHAGNIH